MSLLRSLRAYIGLGPDEEYEDRYLYDLDLRNPDIDLTDDDDFVDGEESEAPSADVSSASSENEPSDYPRQMGGRLATGASTTATQAEPDGEESDDTNPLKVMPDRPDQRDAEGTDGRSRKNRKFKEALGQSSASNDPFAGDDVVRSLDRHRQRPRTITPGSFADSKVLADEFNRGVPIVLDLQGQGRELSRRLIDFASGVCYVLDGSMEKVSPHVFLLVPKSTKVSKQDRRLIEEGGYDR